ncbi:hypothetical protein Dbac_3426 [Desulfomicrobium baculatum DSM 4028]|uniref:Uncharacterized protein n=1 Tax=Desulfomicrobium baculatum (strain DSM 4028 / VKM B-1378 / X) TaxID=525897 RepID=C7LQ16_DESBD|nr:hypothetical protein Dbac_3426 [Desulfomicrobium baculatum DSM 4028]
MRVLIMSILFVAFLFQNTHAENTADISTNSTLNLCSGVWTLIKPAGWCVKDKSGTILPLTASTLVLGCDATPTELSDNLIDTIVDVKCSAPYTPEGIPDVESILIICE